jgi:hypothetical protein
MSIEVSEISQGGHPTLSTMSTTLPGKQSLETICLLLAYKIKYPENFFLLRGNHECASINRIYGKIDGMGGNLDRKLTSFFFLLQDSTTSVSVDTT